MDEDRLVPRLSKTYSTILLILAREYRTRIQNLSTMTPSVEAHDLMVMHNTYSRKPIDMKTLRDAVYYFADFNIVSVSGVRKKDFKDDTLVAILPSVLYLVPNSTVEDLAGLLADYRAESRFGAVTGETDDSDE